MNRKHSLLLGAAVAALCAACASTPKTSAELDTARAMVPQVEASPRAGVAATQIAEARKSLDRANRMAESGGKPDDINFEATLASRNAQIANEKILTAQAKEEISKGEAQRQAVLLQARERENQMRTQQAQMSAEEAELAKQRAAGLEKELADLKGKQTDRGLVITLGDVLFDTGQSTLKPGAYATVERLAAALKDNPERKVLIEGHTDSVGSDEYNMELSQRRAQAVQSALLERGVGSGQISAYGKGKTFPVASNDNAAGRQQNRRVELVFSNEVKTAKDGA
jgi:outer membrane protein OmpA-like peptidoglycan-associated protein